MWQKVMQQREQAARTFKGRHWRGSVLLLFPLCSKMSSGCVRCGVGRGALLLQNHKSFLLFLHLSKNIWKDSLFLFFIYWHKDESPKCYTGYKVKFISSYETTAVSPKLHLPASRRTPSKVAKTSRRILSQMMLGGETWREEEWGDKHAWTPWGCYKTRRSTRRRGSPDSDPLILPADWSDSEEKEREGRRSSRRRSSCPQSARLLSTQRDWRQIRSAEIIKRSHVTGAHSWRFHFSSCARALIAHHYLLSSHRDSFSALACGFG